MPHLDGARSCLLVNRSVNTTTTLLLVLRLPLLLLLLLLLLHVFLECCFKGRHLVIVRRRGADSSLRVQGGAAALR